MLKTNWSKELEEHLERTVDSAPEELVRLGFKYLPEDMSETKDDKIIKHSQETHITGIAGSHNIKHTLNQEYASKRNKENKLNPDKRNFVEKMTKDITTYIEKEVSDIKWK